MMDKEMYTKYNRLNARLVELDALELNIGKLAFYINENDIEDTDCALALSRQLDPMLKYRDALQDRITNGYY